LRELAVIGALEFPPTTNLNEVDLMTDRFLLPKDESKINEIGKLLALIPLSP
jgi:hypothetical protein